MIQSYDPADLEVSLPCATCGRLTTREELAPGMTPWPMFVWVCKHDGCTHTRGEDGQPSVNGQPGRGGRGGKPRHQRTVMFMGKRP